MEEYEVGDLVVTYLYNTSMEKPEVLQHGIVLDINSSLKDILVLDNFGSSRWWNAERWKILKKAMKNRQ